MFGKRPTKPGTGPRKSGKSNGNVTPSASPPPERLPDGQDPPAAEAGRPKP